MAKPSMISTKRCDKLEGHGLHKGRLKEHLVTTNHPRSLISTGGIWNLHGDRSLRAQGKQGFCPCTTWISGCCRCCLEKYVICTDIYMFIDSLALSFCVLWCDSLAMSEMLISVRSCKHMQIWPNRHTKVQPVWASWSRPFWWSISWWQ